MGHKNRILLITNNIEECLACAQALQQNDFEVMVAENLEMAKVILTQQNNDFDLIISNYNVVESFENPNSKDINALYELLLSLNFKNIGNKLMVGTKNEITNDIQKTCERLKVKIFQKNSEDLNEFINNVKLYFLSYADNY
jgi:hypothetical protein